MKIRIDFERQDLKTMLEEYFVSSGWEVLNINDVLDQFESAFPKGITVKADPGTPPAATEPEQVVSTGPPEVIVEDPAVVPYLSPGEQGYDANGFEIRPINGGDADDSKDNPILTRSELGDPEILHILKQSEDLKT